MSTSGDAEQREEALLWLPIAEEDLAAVRVALGADPPLLGVAAYHCQQAVEKLLKALLVLAARPLLKIHDLEKLTREAEAAWPGLRDLVGDTVTVTRWGFAYRCPHAGPAFAARPSPGQLGAVLADADRLHGFVRDRLGSV